MKISLLLISLLFIQNAFADQAPLKLSYLEIEKDVKACHRSIYGCTFEQQLEIAQFDGKILDSVELENIISQDAEHSSVFIPLELNNSELITLAAATSLGIVAFKNDQKISDTIASTQMKTARKISDVGNFMGTSNPSMAIAAGSYFLGMVINDNQLKQVGIFIVGSSIAEAIVTESVKRTFGRKRPYANLGPYDFFNDSSTNKSFWSGHTAQAFTLATVIAESYKDEYPIVPYLAYGFAAITAYARVHDRAHWASDVIAGAVMGHIITKLAMNAMKGNNDGRGGLEISPEIDPRTGGFSVYAKWSERQPEQQLKCSKLPEGTAKINACIAEAAAMSSKH